MAKYLLLALICISLVYMPAYAQEEGIEDIEYGYGTVVEIKKDLNEIVVNEYDYEKDGEAEVTYSIHPEAKVEGISSWKNISKNAYIDIEYVKGENGKRIIKYISIYEEEMPELEME